MVQTFQTHFHTVTIQLIKNRFYRLPDETVIKSLHNNR